LGVFGCVWVCLGVFGCVWVTLGVPGSEKYAGHKIRAVRVEQSCCGARLSMGFTS